MRRPNRGRRADPANAIPPAAMGNRSGSSHWRSHADPTGPVRTAWTFRVVVRVHTATGRTRQPRALPGVVTWTPTWPRPRSARAVRS
jgi:hypothetical protein